MAMTPRENVLATFNHVEPDYVPKWCGASVEFWGKAKLELNLDDENLRLRFRDDFRRIMARYIGPQFELDSDISYRTVFGIDRKGFGYGHAACHPLANATMKDVKEYPWPDPTWMDVSHIAAQAKAYNKQYAILSGEWSPFWHDLTDMFGAENMYLKMFDAPELIDAVLEHIVDYYFDVSKNIFDAAGEAIDIFFIGNDFGCHNGPLLGPTLFKRFITPQLERLIDLGHSYGLKVMMHCCGGFAPLIPLMIEAGLDAVQSVQPSCHGMDLKKLKADFGDKIVFNGAIDSNKVLINGSVEQVRKNTREVLDIMMPSGGFIAGASHDTILEETPVENVLAMFDSIYEYGCYHK